jgi:hypothetical protein
MAKYVDEFCYQVTRRFHTNASKAIEEADRLEHSFKDDPSITSVSTSISTKFGLYHEAGEQDEDMIVRRIHAKLDPNLPQLIRLRSGKNNTMAEFEDRVYDLEHLARSQHERIQSQFDKQEREIEEMRKLLASKSSRPQIQNYSRQDKQMQSNLRQDKQELRNSPMLPAPFPSTVKSMVDMRTPEQLIPMARRLPAPSQQDRVDRTMQTRQGSTAPQCNWVDYKTGKVYSKS